jgi:hypothetical protein
MDSDSGGVNKRDKLYRAFISKAIPSVNYSYKDNYVYATMPKNTALNEVGNTKEGYRLSDRIPVSGFQHLLDTKDAPLRDYRDTVKYKFKDDDGNEYYIVIYLNLRDYMDISFSEVGTGGYDVTNRGKQFKIMATVANAIEKEIDLDYLGTIKGLEYVPAYRDKDWADIDKKRQAGKQIGGDAPRNGRDSLYRAFIAKRIVDLFPNAEVSSESSGTVVKFNREPEYDETLNEVGNSREPYEYSEIERDVRSKEYGPIYGHEDDYPDIYDEREDNPNALVTPGSKAYYTFDNKNGTSYYVDLKNQDGYLEADFRTNQMYKATGDLDQFKIMATVSSIIADELNLDTNGKIRGIYYYPAQTDKEFDSGRSSSTVDNPNKRDRLYRAFITSIAPNAKFRIEAGYIFADIPKDRPVKSGKMGNINELGSSDSGYSVKLEYSSGNIIKPDSYAEYSFRDKDGAEFGIEIGNIYGYLHIEFSSLESGYEDTNKGEQFKIMGTVTSIVDGIVKQGEEYAKENNTENPIKGLKYNPSNSSSGKDTRTVGGDKSKGVNRRDRLYRAYIQKNSPAGSKIITRGPKVTVVFPWGFNKK